MHSTVRGKLAIGTILDPEFTRLGVMLRTLVERHPQIGTELRHGMSGWVLQQVRSARWTWASTWASRPTRASIRWH